MIKVQLWAGSIPYLKYVACHYWLVVYQKGIATRWEVWQLANQCDTSWGHLHKNLMPASLWLTGQMKWLENEWQGKEAQQISETLSNSPDSYTHCYNYRYWPGPNSNSFIQHVLNESNVDYALPPFAIGKDHHNWLFLGKVNTKWQFYTPLISLKQLPHSGIELTCLGLCLGFSINPLSFHSPIVKNRAFDK